MVIRDTSDSALDRFTAGEAGFTGKAAKVKSGNREKAKTGGALPSAFAAPIGVDTWNWLQLRRENRCDARKPVEGSPSDPFKIIKQGDCYVFRDPPALRGVMICIISTDFVYAL